MTRPWRRSVRSIVARDTCRLVVVFEVPADGVRAGIEALRGELAAQRDDQLDGALGIAVGEVLGGATRLERRVALGPVAGHELVHPPLDTP